MTGDHRDIASECWGFALRLYSAPGVSDACLKLQADASVDVMLLLVAGFAASQRRICLSPADIRDMDAACGAWRTQVIHPLRQLRTVLKSGPKPAPNGETEKLRSQIKASELAAERLENDLLAHWLQHKTVHHRDLTRGEVSDVMHSVIRHFLGDAQAHRVVAMQSAIDTLVSAAEKIAA